ncbi:hypothetical protein CAOG_02308 [Capsaspora owczarzaki ATCC 30864]|uniref:2-dehydropantoate 2-reductase n=1 Tax=Capsaspora owczarzaki (strain ATCC 30864) TaxID=595528 RepID=A0A0D2X1N6_CAPO3|nr:hypothetical protein CAOG_02308 [Capsaspora owczarzaki ATCC 30864]KJE91124.1 hypothetical protein CAOG_002308 [Capsaspora owczarzaki ATCC 30864]|eukprot:XP_004349058.2 hypothetical protein CAOG_02308 [Capsaspora owczarzaki ATCC 30864]
MVRVAVLGAGCIGNYVIGSLVYGSLQSPPGEQIEAILVGRDRLKKAVAERNGLALSSYLQRADQAPLQVPLKRSGQAGISVITDIQLLVREHLDAVFIAVKLADTAALIPVLKQLPTSVQIITLQNGVQGIAQLQEMLPEHVIVAGSVPFNVRESGPAAYHQGSSGALCFEQTLDPRLRAAFARAPPGVANPNYYDRSGIMSILYGKLVINLNNSLNALTGIPLRDQFLSKSLRRILSFMQTEALAVLAAARIPTKAFVPVPLWVVPWVLCLPDWLFPIVSATSINIDPTARSSMYDDLTLHRKTELSFLNGEIQRLARLHGIATPVIDKISELVCAAEAANAGSPQMSSDTLVAELRVVAPGKF